MSNNKVIEFKNVSKRYFIGERSIRTLHEDVERLIMRFFGKNRINKKEIWALKDINFKIERGETIGLIGPNGSGKTTMFKLISHITYPNKGEIFVNGSVGSFIELNAGFHPELTGLENIYLIAAIRGMRRKEIRKHLDEILNFAEIEYFKDTPIKHYSSGMKIRLGFSVAVLCPADILLIDEVTAVADLHFQEKYFNKLKELQRHNGKTILFVSHDMEKVKQICPRVIYVSGGKIIADSNASEAINRYLDFLHLESIKSNTSF